MYAMYTYIVQGIRASPKTSRRGITLDRTVHLFSFAFAFDVGSDVIAESLAIAESDSKGS